MEIKKKEISFHLSILHKILKNKSFTLFWEGWINMSLVWSCPIFYYFNYHHSFLFSCFNVSIFNWWTSIDPFVRVAIPSRRVSQNQMTKKPLCKEENKILQKKKKKKKNKCVAFRRCPFWRLMPNPLLLLLQSEGHIAKKTKGFHFHMPRCCVIQFHFPMWLWWV